MTADMWNSAGPIFQWRGGRFRPPGRARRRSLHNQGCESLCIIVAGRKRAIEKLELAGESATSSQWVRYERCLMSNSKLLKFSIPQSLDQVARVLVSS